MKIQGWAIISQEGIWTKHPYRGKMLRGFSVLKTKSEAYEYLGAESEKVNYCLAPQEIVKVTIEGDYDEQGNTDLQVATGG